MTVTTPPVYYLNVSVRGYAVQIWLNDAPICRSPLDDPYLVIPSVSEWMIAGTNTLRVEVLGVAPPSVPDPASPRRILVALCVGALDEVVAPGQEQVLCEVRHEPPADAGPAAAPGMLLTAYELAIWPRWTWQDAPVFGDDEAADAELWTFLEAIYGDLTDGRLDAFLAREQVKFAEVGPRYGSDPAQATAMTRAQFAEISADGPWSVAPLQREDVVMRRCCGGRVGEFARRDGEPVLRSGSDAPGAGWSMPVFVARIDGLLEIIR